METNSNLFPMIPIGNICEHVSSGGTPSRKRFEYFSDNLTGHLWVKSKELLDCSIKDTEEHITDKGLKNSSAKYYPVNTVLMAMYGANVGQLGWLRQPATVNQAVCGMVVNKKVAYFRYVFYSLLHRRSEIIGQARGAAQQNLNQDIIRSFEIPQPPLSTQRKIAAILSAYDDLVENNTRCIQILEEMAQAIYRQWFVEYKFIGCEDIPLVDSGTELGEIPQGWEVRELQDVDLSIIDGDRGKNYPRKNEFSGEGYCLFLNAGNIQNDKFDYSKKDFITIEKDSLLRKGRLQPNDIILTTRGTVGRLAFHSENALYKNVRINSGMVIIRSNSPTQNSLYWFHLLKSSWLKEQYQLFSSGAAQPQLPIKDMKRINVLLPVGKLMLHFCEVAKPIFALIENLQQKNANLRATRDLLLPRLVSGELDVSELKVGDSE